MKRKINIDIADESIEISTALELVRRVVEQGRISNEGECYCYATVFSSPPVAVLAKANRLDDRSPYVTSDSFRIEPDRKVNHG